MPKKLQNPTMFLSLLRKMLKLFLGLSKTTLLQSLSKLYFQAQHAKYQQRI